MFGRKSRQIRELEEQISHLKQDLTKKQEDFRRIANQLARALDQSTPEKIIKGTADATTQIFEALAEERGKLREDARDDMLFIRENLEKFQRRVDTARDRNEALLEFLAQASYQIGHLKGLLENKQMSAIPRQEIQSLVVSWENYNHRTFVPRA